MIGRKVVTTIKNPIVADSSHAQNKFGSIYNMIDGIGQMLNNYMQSNKDGQRVCSLPPITEKKAVVKKAAVKKAQSEKKDTNNRKILKGTTKMIWMQNSPKQDIAQREALLAKKEQEIEQKYNENEKKLQQRELQLEERKIKLEMAQKNAQDKEKTNQENEKLIQKKEERITEREKIITEKENSILTRENAITEKERINQEKEKSIQEKEKNIQEAENTIQEKEKEIQAKIKSIQEMETSIQEKEKSCIEMQKTMQEKENIIQEKEKNIQELQKNIKDNEKCMQEIKKDAQEKKKITGEKESQTKDIEAIKETAIMHAHIETQTEQPITENPIIITKNADNNEQKTYKIHHSACEIIKTSQNKKDSIKSYNTIKGTYHASQIGITPSISHSIKVFHFLFTESIAATHKTQITQNSKPSNNLVPSPPKKIEELQSTAQQQNKGFSICPLENIGNSCYLNTAIKCIFACFPFINYVNTNLKYISDKSESKINSLFTDYYNEFANLISQMLKSNSKLSPDNFKKELALLDSTFDNTKQNDCFQAIISILDNFHRSLKKEGDQHMPGFPTKDIDGLKNYDRTTSDYIDECLKVVKAHSSIVYDMFLNMNVLKYECSGCGHLMIKFEVNTGNPLDIQHFTKIEECIKQYFTGEVYKEYLCKICKHKVDLNITRNPIMFSPILMFQLKRFIKGSNGKYCKDNTEIKYPFLNEPLLLDDFIPSKLKNAYYSEMVSMEYYLIAIAVHNGSLEGGHYYAYLYNIGKNKWQQHNDSMIYEQIPAPHPKDAITLIYMRKEMFDVNIPITINMISTIVQ